MKCVYLRRFPFNGLCTICAVMASKVLEYFTHYFKNARNYDKSFQKLKILSVGDGNFTGELTIEEQHLNSRGGLHGGCSSTLIDALSIFGLSTHKKSEGSQPVSVDLHITFVKGAKLGDEVLIDAKTTKIGKSLAFVDIQILNKKTNDLLVKGTQTAFLVEKKKEM